MHSKCFLVVLLLCLWHVSAEKRTLTSEVNPNCKPDGICKNSTLVHVTSTGQKSTYHYLWAFVAGYTPAIFSFETDNDAKLQVHWDKLLNPANNANSLSFTGTVINSFAVELSHLYFNNATKNNNTNVYTILPFEGMEWKATDQIHSNEISFKFESDTHKAKKPLNGTLDLNLSAFSQTGRSDSIPRLQFTESSNILQVILSKVFLPEGKFPDDPNNKYIQAQLVSNLTFAFEGKDVSAILQEHTTIDDEYSPGIFQRFIYNLLSKGSASNETAYFEWKPVAYYDPSKQIAKSIKVTDPDVVKSSPIADKSILNAYYAGRKYEASALNKFKFGNVDDDFNYQDNRYLEFSMAYGLNKVPEETLSMTLKIVIAVGLGVPMVLFLISIIYTIVKKVRSNNDFSTLNEDTTS